MAVHSAPLALGDQTTITRGQNAIFNSAKLAPKITVPYEVTSIRMLAYPSLNTTGEPSICPDSSLRGFLKWQFQLGYLPLTDSFIPMWNLCPTRQLATELGGYFEWRFRRPLVLSPASRIDAKVTLDVNTPNAGASPTITVAVSYAGRIRPDLERVPDMIDVPFCSCWDTTTTNSFTASDGISFRNPLQKDIDIEEFICRVENQSTGLNGDDSTTIQIFDPYGKSLSRAGPVQIHAMFPNDTRSFPYSGTLPSGSHFAVRLTSVPSVTYRPMLSYLGSRRERSL